MGKKANATQPSLVTSMYPTLSKTAVAIGKFASVPGKYWHGCPAADKEKRYLCTVIEFMSVHDFGNGFKGAGFSLKEMGEDGRGSLEPGVASGAEFVMAYPVPFVEYYWFANRAELKPDICIHSSIQMSQMAAPARRSMARQLATIARPVRTSRKSRWRRRSLQSSSTFSVCRVRSMWPARLAASTPTNISALC